ncbi:hypothetical protein [Piscinibacter sp. XHJ-5]|uniref:hypothetical protein n=1 Tax=Piscinibacter sp. XHJ-5 TaxID=3037797 RepID=UPI002452EBD9|nr:hypothetical protein [Piscinibacter sp. XHJ-5]
MSALASADAASQRRQLRAAVAQRLLAKAPAAAAALDWDMLGQAPLWLAMSDAALTQFARQVGAVLCAPALRLWIDARRLAAARAALGETFLQALLAQPDVPAIEPQLSNALRLDTPEQVGALLQAAGAGVLLASLPPGLLQAAAAALMAPAAALAMPASTAQALVSRARQLAATRSEG